MFLELTREELAMLANLVEERIRKNRWSEKNGELNGVPPSHFSDFTHELDGLERLLHKLHSCECDVFA
ncbi:MAG: hypothetical protein FJ295_16855 [Planctomycetes bacterium]|nr:hypothetical protein [Planctomycetota bacterium]